MLTQKMPIVNSARAFLVFLTAFVVLWTLCAGCAPLNHLTQSKLSATTASTSAPCPHHTQTDTKTPAKELCSTEFWDQSETQKLVDPPRSTRTPQGIIARISNGRRIVASTSRPLYLRPPPPPMRGSLFAQKTLLRI